MKKQIRTSGYILSLTMAMIALFMFVATYLANRSALFSSYTTTMVDRQKAYQLAYGSLQLAISQLSFVEQKEKEQPSAAADKQATAKQKKDEESPAKQLLKTILPTLNQGQTFALKRTVEGIDGAVGIALGAEEGKININRLYDYEKHTFVGQGQPEGDMRLFFQEFFELLQRHIGVNLFADFEQFLKSKEYPLNDVTELLTIKSFEVFKNAIFYDPLNGASGVNGKPIFLTDLFTVSAFKKEIEPWLLSVSLKTVLAIKSESNKIAYDEILKNFKEKADWKTDWEKILKPFYGIDFAAVPKTMQALLSAEFSPQFFWVVGQGTYKKATVTLWALVEREQSSKGATAAIRRIYTI